MKLTTALAVSVPLAIGAVQSSVAHEPAGAERASHDKKGTGESDVRARFEAQDTDNDGNVDENEMTGDHVWRRNFDAVDVDDNGLLTLAEVTDFEANADPAE